MRRLAVLTLLCLVGCGAPESGNQQAEPPPLAFDGALAAQAPAKLAHGERLTRVLGCRGCHGKELQGKRFYEVYASNLTRDLPAYSDTELRRLLRDGVHPTGRDVWAMPSELFQHLSGPDEAALIAYLRTLTPAGPPTGKRLPWEPDAVKMIAAGKIKPAAAFAAELRNVGPVDLGPRHELGRYITRLTCAECHGPELKGGDTPDLIVAGAYSREEFERLITQGIPNGPRKLGLMADVARSRFAHLTPHERDALYAYLRARAEQPQ